jgi:hypothetical protein
MTSRDFLWHIRFHSNLLISCEIFKVVRLYKTKKREIKTGISIQSLLHGALLLLIK